MYKKITHSIVEEHFDHPLASQIQKSLYKVGRPTTEILDENKFRADIRGYFQNYIDKNNAIVNSMNGTEDSLIDAFEGLFSNIDAFGNMTKPLYSSEFSERLNSSMRILPILLVSLVHAKKIGQAGMNISARMENWSNDLATQLASFNDNVTWQTTNDTFKEYTTALQNKINAISKKDAAAEQAADNVIMSKLDVFSNLFANTMVNQHPDRFIKSQ